MQTFILIYLLPLLCLLLGVMFSVMASVSVLHNKYPQYSIRDIFYTFLREEWNNLLVSLLVICTYLLFIFITKNNGYIFKVWFAKWGMYVLALVLGYGGQRIAYHFLKST